MYTTYILKTNDKKFYIGSTGDITDRISRHNKGECRFTKSRLPVELAYQEDFVSRSEAVDREMQLKSWKSSRSINELINSVGGPIV